MANPVGRPRGTPYDPVKAMMVCEMLMHGRTLRSITSLPDMPSVNTLMRWLEQHSDFRELYARAREAQADVMFDEIQRIADDGTNDWMTQNDPDNPGYRLNGEHVQRSRLRVDTLKWRLSKMFPKKYGDPAAMQVNVQQNIEITDRRREIDALVEVLLQPGAVQRTDEGAALVRLEPEPRDSSAARSDNAGPPEGIDIDQLP